jgi:branched-subunit amino acid aminotransferase/4-amino-4-deoxychorismate lyase
MDGKLVDFEKATVHFLSPALHYGLGVMDIVHGRNARYDGWLDYVFG